MSTASRQGAKAQRDSKAARIAYEFAKGVSDYIGSENLAEVVRRNSTEDYFVCCASHDFCDANVFMNDAFKKVLGRNMWMSRPSDSSLWDEAWSRARANHFDIHALLKKLEARA